MVIKSHGLKTNGRRRLVPKVEVLPADPEKRNRSNPFDAATPAERRAARIALLGTVVARHREELEAAQENGKEEIEMDGEKLITTKEAYERLAISERAFYRWVKQAGVSCYRFGRSARWRWSEVEREMENSKHGAASEKEGGDGAGKRD